MIYIWKCHIHPYDLYNITTEKYTYDTVLLRVRVFLKEQFNVFKKILMKAYNNYFTIDTKLVWFVNL